MSNEKNTKIVEKVIEQTMSGSIKWKTKEADEINKQLLRDEQDRDLLRWAVDESSKYLQSEFNRLALFGRSESEILPKYKSVIDLQERRKHSLILANDSIQRLENILNVSIISSDTFITHIKIYDYIYDFYLIELPDDIRLTVWGNSGFKLNASFSISASDLSSIFTLYMVINGNEKYIQNKIRSPFILEI